MTEPNDGDAVSRMTADAQAHADGHTGPECQWCPVCQFVAVLRGERPELTERVAEAGAALTTVLRAVFDPAASGAAAGGGAPDPSPRVQHIDLGNSDDGPDPE